MTSTLLQIHIQTVLRLISSILNQDHRSIINQGCAHIVGYIHRAPFPSSRLTLLAHSIVSSISPFARSPRVSPLLPFRLISLHHIHMSPTTTCPMLVAPPHRLSCMYSGPVSRHTLDFSRSTNGILHRALQIKTVACVCAPACTQLNGDATQRDALHSVRRAIVRCHPSKKARIWPRWIDPIQRSPAAGRTAAMGSLT